MPTNTNANIDRLTQIEQRLAAIQTEMDAPDADLDALTAEAAGTDFFGVTHGATGSEELSRYPHIAISPDLMPLILH